VLQETLSAAGQQLSPASVLACLPIPKTKSTPTKLAALALVEQLLARDLPHEHFEKLALIIRESLDEGALSLRKKARELSAQLLGFRRGSGMS
jgi:hypothetical protein